MLVKNKIKEDLFSYVGNTNIYYSLKKRVYDWQYTNLLQKVNSIKFNKLIYIILVFPISTSATLGKELYLDHFVSIIVVKEGIIGVNCDLSHNYVIVSSNRAKCLGNEKNVNFALIERCDVIVANIYIGNSVFISQNAYVNFDVPSDSIVICNPGIIKKSSYATDNYVINKVCEGQNGFYINYYFNI